MITKTFGDMLFSPSCPSPESLKRMVIISTKPPKDYLQAKDAKNQESITTQRKERIKLWRNPGEMKSKVSKNKTSINKVRLSHE